MYKKIKDININYVDYGNREGKVLLLLHGWGQNIEMMKSIGDGFSKDYRIIIIDLPGFGQSSDPDFAWDVPNYVEYIKLFLNDLNIDNPIIAGHSYGGKIGLLYASKYSVDKLVLFASPFKKEIKKLSFKIKFLKFIKKVPILNKLEEFAKKHIGSEDYKNATPLMRKVLVNTVNLDITEDVKKIEASTLIIWGSNDDAVPVERAYELENLISDAGVVIFDGCTHYAYLERLKQTINVMRIFLES